MMAGGGGGGPVVLPVPLNGMDCVKLDPAGILARLLRAALSVNTRAALSFAGVAEAV